MNHSFLSQRRMGLRRILVATGCWLAGFSIAILTACGSQDGTNTDVASNNSASTASKTVAIEATKTAPKSPLLASLAANYPNGQLPSNRVAQAAQDLAQNPAALKLTAETAVQSAASSSPIQAQSSSGSPIHAQATAADFAPVQRIQNTTLYGAYFFSIYPGEVTSALAGNPNWRLEGPAFWASLATGLDLHPVHRFQNKLNGSYLYTIYDGERANIVANYSATFTYEGIAWYARQTPAPGWSTLYRFRNLTNGTYLFSAFESEKDAIVANYPAIFALEGVAYYVRQDAQADLVVTLLGATRVVANTLYTYSASVVNASASAWSWLWGDGSDAGSTNPTSKVWYKPGSYSSTVTATVNGAPVTATQTVTVVGSPIVGGAYHTCALKSDSTVNCWGYNVYGQLGDGTTTQRLSPTSVPGLTGVAALTAGSSHTCALKTDGTVRCWGNNGDGQLGDVTTTPRVSPTAVPSLTGVAALAAGAYHTCALKTDGTVRCWGNNSDGQLGDGTTNPTLNPTVVPDLTGVTALAAGAYHTCALQTDGAVRCWGRNGQGQLGDGTTTQRLSPTAVPGLTGVTALAAGGVHTCALQTDSMVNCWGYNGFGQLGDGTTTQRLNPTAVPGLTGVAVLAAGTFHTCALNNDGTARCWGNNFNGRLGDGTTTQRLSPTVVPSLTGVAALAAGLEHSCALNNDGTARCWGFNGNGQLGDGTPTQRLSPTLVLGGAVFWK
jgi:alpha-tubulin suppressor-like RCC1 family protein